MTKVIRLPGRKEAEVYTHERGFLDALNSENVSLTGQHWVGQTTTVVFMGGSGSDEHLAIKMDENVEPCDLDIEEFDSIFPGESWKLFTSKV